MRILVLVGLLVAGPAFAEPVALPAAKQLLGANNRRGWTQRSFSDPGRPSTKPYRYLAHAIVPSSPGGRALLADPAAFSTHGTPLVSTSVVDETHGTYMNAGFLLQAPSKNVVATANRDALTANADASPHDETLRQNQRFPIMTPHGLLKSTSSRLGLYNEVIMARSTSAGSVMPTGLFVVIDPRTDRPAVPSKDYRLLQRSAKKANLPLVELHPTPAVSDFVPGNHGRLVQTFGEIHKRSSNGSPIRLVFDPPQDEKAPDYSKLTSVRWRDGGISPELELGASPGFHAVRGIDTPVPDKRGLHEKRFAAEVEKAFGADSPVGKLVRANLPRS